MKNFQFSLVFQRSTMSIVGPSESEVPLRVRSSQLEWIPLTLETVRSKFEFSFVAPIHFLQKKLGEVDKISSTFILCDHVRNSHDHSVSQSIDITRRNLMLITLRA